MNLDQNSCITNGTSSPMQRLHCHFYKLRGGSDTQIKEVATPRPKVLASVLCTFDTVLSNV
jgi:hypothetical protein